jgi:DNA-binding NtrC family response regulator
VLVDLRLPDLDGTAVIRAAHENVPVVRAVVITGQPQSSPLVQGILQQGMGTVYYKPLDIPQLLETLERLTQ